MENILCYRDRDRLQLGINAMTVSVDWIEFAYTALIIHLMSHFKGGVK